MRIKEVFLKFGSKRFKCITVYEKHVVIVLNPIVNFDILEGHQYISNFIFICDFSFVEVRSEILYELRKDSRRDSPRRKDRHSFVRVMELNGSHVMNVGVEWCMGHCERVVT